MTVGAYEAKTHLPRLLDRVLKGEEIVITRNGVPVARLVPCSVESSQQRALEAAEGLARLRCTLKARGVQVSSDEIRQWLGEGRRG